MFSKELHRERHIRHRHTQGKRDLFTHWFTPQMSKWLGLNQAESSNLEIFFSISKTWAIFHCFIQARLEVELPGLNQCPYRILAL